MTNDLESLDGLWTMAWGLLEHAAQTRTPVQLATVSTDHWPEVRSVVLRRCDPLRCQVSLYTDSQSDKVASLAATPRAAIHLWQPGPQVQLRLDCKVTVQTGPATDADWAGVPDHARQSYGVDPAPGTIIPGPVAYHKRCEQDQFAVLLGDVVALDVVSLAMPHRRAVFRSQGGDWVSNWLAP